MLERQKLVLTGWSKGLVKRRAPKLSFPPDALYASQNADISNGIIETIGGRQSIAGNLPDGTIRMHKQVRFPGTGATYIVAQVEGGGTDEWIEATVGVDAPDQRYQHGSVYVESTGQMIVAGGVYGALANQNLSDIWAFCQRTGLWSELTLSGDTFTAGAQKLLVYGTTLYIWSSTKKLQVIDLTTNVCTEITTTGDVPTYGGRTGGPHWISSDGSYLYLLDGAYQGIFYGLFRLDLSTYVWTDLGGSEWTDFSDPDYSLITSELVGSYIYTLLEYTGASPFVRVYRSPLTSAVWTKIGDLTLTTDMSTIGELTSCVFDDEIHIFKCQYDSDTADFGIYESIYDTTAHTLTGEQSGTTTVSSQDVEGFSMVISANGDLLSFGGMYWDGDTRRYLPVYSGVTGSNVGNGLYASPTHLPATTMTWYKIADLGENAGICSITTLGDAAIITEGIENPPWVWRGCLETDGSDWASPITVLISEDGEHHYDISESVLDNDPNTSAPVGDLTDAAEIAIRLPDPNVDALWIEMGTANTATDSAMTTGTRSIGYSTTSDIVRMDMRNSLIGYWKQSSGVAGNFEGSELTLTDAAVVDAGAGKVQLPYTAHSLVDGQTVRVYNTTNYNATYVLEVGTTGQNYLLVTAAFVGETLSSAHCRLRPTLGATKECPYVEAGAMATIDGVDYRIASITGDGEADGEVSLATAATSEACSDIYTVDVDLNAVTVANDSSGDASAATWADGTNSNTGSQSCVRQIVSASEISSDGSAIKLKIKSRATTYTYVSGGVTITRTVFAATNITYCSIVEQDSGANGTGTPTQVTFSGGADGCSFTEADQEITSDSIEFALDQTKSYIITMDMGVCGLVRSPSGIPSASISYADPFSGSTRSGLLNYQTGAGYYIHTLYGSVSNPGLSSVPVTAPEQTYFYDQQTVTTSTDSSIGFSWVPGYCVGITAVLVPGIEAVPTLPAVSYTNTFKRLQVWGLDAITGITVNETVPTGCYTYHAISNDGSKLEWWVFMASAWRQIVDFDSVWKYNSSATATPSWSAATVNSLIGALQDAYTVTQNKMNTAAFEAITAVQWADFYTAGTDYYFDFAAGLLGAAPFVPELRGYTVTYTDTGTTTVTGYAGGQWVSGQGWEDDTVVGDSSLAQSGAFTYYGCTPMILEQASISEIPGYWLRLQIAGTSSGTTISAIKYKAPCQALSSIGVGVQASVLAFVTVNGTTGAHLNYATVVSDYTETSTSEATVALTTADYLYVSGLLRFNEMLLVIGSVANQNTADLIVEYWNGMEWHALGVEDGTATGGKTFNQRGKVKWAMPDDWQECSFLPAYDKGYALRLSVSANLTASTAISECRLATIPNDLVKHFEAVSFANRIALCGRNDAPDQVGISAELLEYDWTSLDSGAWRVGTPDRIIAAVSAWGSVVVAKPSGWFYFTGSGFQGHETPFVPVNSRVVVKSPLPGSNGSQSALAFLGYQGAYSMSGLHLDQKVDAVKPMELSEYVDWWEDDALPRLDKSNLWRACGELWGDFLVWSVPMITADGQTSQTTNNRLIMFNTRISVWLGPMTYSMASLAVAYSYVAGALGQLGPPLLLGGDYAGTVSRLFYGTTDNGTAITTIVESGELTMGLPGTTKDLLYVRVFGEAGNSPTLNFYVDGLDSIADTRTLSSLTTENFYDDNMNLEFRTLSIEITGSGPISIYGVELEWQVHDKHKGFS